MSTVQKDQRYLSISPLMREFETSVKEYAAIALVEPTHEKKKKKEGGDEETVSTCRLVTPGSSTPSCKELTLELESMFIQQMACICEVLRGKDVNGLKVSHFQDALKELEEKGGCSTRFLEAWNSCAFVKKRKTASKKSTEDDASPSTEGAPTVEDDIEVSAEDEEIGSNASAADVPKGTDAKVPVVRRFRMHCLLVAMANFLKHESGRNTLMIDSDLSERLSETGMAYVRLLAKDTVDFLHDLEILPPGQPNRLTHFKNFEEVKLTLPVVYGAIRTFDPTYKTMRTMDVSEVTTQMIRDLDNQISNRKSANEKKKAARADEGEVEKKPKKETKKSKTEEEASSSLDASTSEEPAKEEPAVDEPTKEVKKPKKVKEPKAETDEATEEKKVKKEKKIKSPRPE